MGGRYPRVRIVDIGRVITGKTPTTSDPANFGGPYPFVTIPDLGDTPYVVRTERTISRRGAAILGNCLLPPNAVLMSCIATIGKCGITTMESFSNQQINSVVCNDGVVPQFLFYCFRLMRNDLEASGGGGSVYTNVSKTRFSDLTVPLPPLPEQRAIAAILGTMDDKIDLNRRTNETLEAMARALFKSWFVDFDPVRRNIARKQGKADFFSVVSAKEDALFPDSFVDSELGRIPKGWRVGALGDIVQQRVERVEPSPLTAGMPYVPIDCIFARSLYLSQFKGGAEAQSSLIRFYAGDILFGAMRPYFHKVCIAPFDGTTRTTAFVLVPRLRGDYAYSVLLLHHEDTVDYATRHSTGSTIPYAKWTDSLDGMPLIVPPEEIRTAFNDRAKPLLDAIPIKLSEDDGLRSARDALLPKLLSGEIRIKDAVKFVEDAA